MPEYSIAKLDRNGEVKEIAEISKEEYLSMKNDIAKDLNPQNFKSTSEL